VKQRAAALTDPWHTDGSRGRSGRYSHERPSELRNAVNPVPDTASVYRL
jgi:hypothetical protein